MGIRSDTSAPGGLEGPVSAGWARAPDGAEGAGAAGEAVWVEVADGGMRSASVIRPSGPVPLTLDKSIPRSAASRRRYGEARTRLPPPAGGAGGAGGGAEAADFGAGLAGGAAAAVVLALCRMQLREIVVVARRPEQASELCLRVSPENTRPVDWDDLDSLQRLARDTTVVVNATPADAAELPLPLGLLSNGCVVIDLRYRPRPVDLVTAAQARGLRATDGVEMLLFQGMLSFQRWTGAPPPWHAAREALVAALQR